MLFGYRFPGRRPYWAEASMLSVSNGFYLLRDSVEVASSSFIPEKNVVLLKMKRKAVIRSNASAMSIDVAFPPGNRADSNFITRLFF